MPAGRLCPGDEQRCVLLDGGVDREGTRPASDIDREIGETKAARESRLPARRSSFEAASPSWIIADEILFANQCARRGIER